MTPTDHSSPNSAANDAIEGAAARLLDARTRGVQISGLGSMAPAAVADSYAIADAVAAGMTAPVVGWKVGCTSAFAQKMLGSPEPISGRVHELHRANDTAPLPVAVPPGAQLEGELAFTLTQSLDPANAPFSRDDVVSALGSLHPAIEVVGGRCDVGLEAPILIIIADASVNNCLAIGPAVQDWAVADLPSAAGTMTVDDEVTGRGTGADVLGNPVESVIWLANHLAERGIGLNAGEVITCGTCTQITPATPGTTATADFGPYGSVSIAIST